MARTQNSEPAPIEAEVSPFFDPQYGEAGVFIGGSAADALAPGAMPLAPGANRLHAQAAMAAIAAFDRRAPQAASDDEASLKHLTYWKFCMDVNCHLEGHVTQRGWIKIGPASKGIFAHEQVTDYRNATHGVSLEPLYGAWVQNQWYQDGLRGGGAYDARFPYGTYANLFKKPGGIFEMPVTQWLSHGFHKLEEFQGLREDVEAYPILKCKQCIGREFLEETHLNNHRSVMHKESLQAVASAEAMGEKFAEFSNQGGNEMMLMMMAQMKEMQETIRLLQAEKKA